MPLQDTIRQIRARVEALDWFQLSAFILGLLLCYYFLKNLKGFCDGYRDECSCKAPEIEPKPENMTSSEDKKVC